MSPRCLIRGYASANPGYVSLAPTVEILVGTKDPSGKPRPKRGFVDQRGKNVFKVRLSVLLPPYLDAVTFSGTVTFAAFSKPCGLGYRLLRPT